ncbi:MAG: 3-oxoacyl-ACP reductase [Pseudomonadota bacterium]|nr:3-oxoacyl-ACP reductase [Pseudomonadota bacterium]
MSNFLESVLDSSVGRSLMKQVLPKSIPLRRYTPSEPTFFSGRVLLGAGDNAALTRRILHNLQASAAELFYPAAARGAATIVAAAEELGIRVTGIDCSPEMNEKFDALIFDASGFADTTELNQLYYFFHPVMRKLNSNGRVIVLGRPHMQAGSGEQAAAMRALEGFSRSVAKEIGKKSATCQALYVENGAEANLDAPLRFILSARSAYVDGQVFQVRKAADIDCPDWHQPLAGKVALVTGASRGIGEAIARTLARDGARVLGLDIPPAAAELEQVMAAIDGEVLLADISSAEAPQLISDKLQAMGGGDIIVHNAGITRDKTLANMPEHWWNMTIDINLSAEERINHVLLEQDTLNHNGRIICVSSMNGIAGQAGQTNYAASKAGVIGYVQYMADPLMERGITINAVAPGFIETAMTDAIPVITREIGRRLNSLSQGGQPVDVAETIAFFANPASGGVSGNIVRVCGQSLVGA